MYLYPRLDTKYPFITVGSEKISRINIVGSLRKRQNLLDPIDFCSHSATIYTKAFIQMSAVFAELELSILRARVKSGLANAREKGRKIGRPQTTKDDIPAIFYKHYPAYAAGHMNVTEFARVCNLSRPTVYKYLKLVG